MALIIGSESADSGMSRAIYIEMDRLLSPPLQNAVNEGEGEVKVKAQEALTEARKGWKKLSFAIANGMIEHLKSNMEIHGVEVFISDVNTTVSTATTCPAGAGSGTGSGSGTATGQQSNDGTGHVK